MAPWTHTYLSPQGERRLCCASREQARFTRQYIDQEGGNRDLKFEPDTLEEHWNSSHLRSVRKRMLAGESLPECEVCSSQMLNLHTYQRYFTETLFPHLVGQAIQSTDETGRTTMEPISFDYRFFNACNFKCRMCGSQLSSAWEAENRQHGAWDRVSDAWMLPENRDKMRAFQEKTAEAEFMRAIEEKRMEEIYWVGGEPLIWDLHWRAMNRIVELGTANQIIVRYNTNLSRVEHKGTRLFEDLLPLFKGYNVCASIDAPGKIGEYVRTGLDWKLWLSNFERGVRQKKLGNKGHDSIVMDVTLTLPGLFGMKELLNIANDLGVKMYVKIVFAFDPSKILSPLALPREILEPFIEDLAKSLRPGTNERTEALLGTILDIPKRRTFMEEFPNWRDGLRAGKQELKRLALIRGDGTDGKLRIEDIFGARPEILKWWESIA